MFYAQRIDVPRLLRADEFSDTCAKLGILLETLLENLLKVWLGVEYLRDQDFWRRRCYADGHTQIKGGLITTYTPAYIYLPLTTGGSNSSIDIIALDKRSFDGAMELLPQNGGTITSRSLSFENFPADVPVEGFYAVDYEAETEQLVGFNAPRSRKDVLRKPTPDYRYFSVTIATDYKIGDGSRLIAIGLEENHLVLDIVGGNVIDEPLNNRNQKEFVGWISVLLDRLYRSPADVCTRKV